MKTVPLTIRRCPAQVHQALKQKAEANRRSLNNEALLWLEREAQSQRAVTGAQWAARLRRARKQLSEKEHQELAADIETSRRLMNREHLR